MSSLVSCSVAAAELSPDEQRDLLRAWAKPDARQELYGLGVRVLVVVGGPTHHVHVPADDKPYVMGRVVAWLASDTRGRTQKGTPGRPRVVVTHETLLEIFRQSLERARSTAKPPQPTYAAIAADAGVTRTWVTPIVKWVVTHQREALDAIRLSEIPKRFSAFVSDLQR
jgi:hypothetical protein